MQIPVAEIEEYFASHDLAKKIQTDYNKGNSSPNIEGLIERAYIQGYRNGQKPITKNELKHYDYLSNDEVQLISYYRDIHSEAIKHAIVSDIREVKKEALNTEEKQLVDAYRMIRSDQLKKYVLDGVKKASRLKI